MSKVYTIIAGKAYDAMLYPSTTVVGGTSVPDKEGQLEVVGSVAYPILREDTLSLAMRVSGAFMTAIYSYNNALKSNPVIVIIGSSHSISLGLSGSQTLQYKLQAYFNANWGGATVTNLGVAGEYSNHFLPTAQGGLSDRNIDAALSYNPDIILYIAPTNDATINTPAQATANIKIIRDYARQHGSKIFIHSPLPRGSFGSADQQDLADSDVLWKAAFTYEYFDGFNSVLRDKTAGTAGAPNMTYYQSDQTHLNDLGTTFQADTLIIPVLERQLRANTAYAKFEIEKSSNGTTGWTLFDTITNQQTIKKTFTKEPGYFRARALLLAGMYLPYSNIVQVTNIVPTANAGEDKSLTAGTTSTTVTGSGSDTDGTIVAYLWTIISGTGITLVNANTATVTVNGMINSGNYTLRLTVTDNAGSTASDDVVITVASAGNVSPTANAGADTDYDFGTTTATLTGTGTDPDGTIASYAWTQVSGPNTASINSAATATTGITGMIGGVYVFRLTVTDNGGDTGSDDVRIRIVSAIAKFNMSKEAAAVSGWNNVAGDPTNNNATATATDSATGFGFRARAASNWNNAVGGENSKNGWGQTTDVLGEGVYTGSLPAQSNYWYNVNDTFTTKFQCEAFGLSPTKQYRLKLLGSRSNANGATGPYSVQYNIQDGNDTRRVDITNTYQNTGKGATPVNADYIPKQDGTIWVAVNPGSAGSVAHINTITIEQF